MSISISVMPQMEKLVDISSKAMYDAAKTQQKIGKYDEAKWLEIDGLRGVACNDPGDSRNSAILDQNVLVRSSNYRIVE